MREYRTYSKMLHDPYSGAVAQPDLKHIETLHRILETLDDNTAMMIDLIVADLIYCNRQPSVPAEVLPNEIMPK